MTASHGRSVSCHTCRSWGSRSTARRSYSRRTRSTTSSGPARSPSKPVRLRWSLCSPREATMKSAYTIAMIAAIAACESPKPADNDLATAIAKELAAACPVGAEPSDETARNDCAGNLTELAVLRDAMREPFIWGGQAQGAGYRLDKSTNKFNARV